MRNIRTPEEQRASREVVTYKWSCPVDGCGWSHIFVVEGMTTKELVDLSLLGSVEISATPWQTAEVEAGFATIRKHLEEHSDEELAGTGESKP